MTYPPTPTTEHVIDLVRRLPAAEQTRVVLALLGLPDDVELPWRRPRRRPKAARDAEIVGLRAEGMLLKHLARRFGMKESAVRQVLRRAAERQEKAHAGTCALVPGRRRQQS